MQRVRPDCEDWHRHCLPSPRFVSATNGTSYGPHHPNCILYAVEVIACNTAVGCSLVTLEIQ